MSSFAKLFRNARSQAVRLPTVEDGVLLKPVYTDVDTWFQQLDEKQDPSFMKQGRSQPEMPVRKIF